MTTAELLHVPPSRAEALRRISAALRGAARVVLTTHVDADADGVGSEVGLAEWLAGRGAAVTLVNPTPFPPGLRFLLEGSAAHVADWGTAAAEEAVRRADRFVVLDTGEPARVGALAPFLPPEGTLVLDHHPAGETGIGSAAALRDPSAAATGELVWDLIRLAGDVPTGPAALALYVALVSDTGSFRYGNTTPRVHAVAAELLGQGVDPEQVYRRLFATAPRRRLELLREALATLETDPQLPLAWMTVSDAMVRRTGADGEDFDGLNEYARSLEGTEIAILFRETDAGGTRMSLRSNGDADVARIAALFGGGGHVKAAGARTDAPPAETVPRVLQAAREALRAAT